ncbi:TetR/AcrR family transcriptional regulator [Kineococcus terrestris]|uniref:TetR/AcrR family transcriptional regulator n=1 Tax=Kineococcus terrestris TaxID=2044856 RepID=UPI0034DB00D5
MSEAQPGVRRTRNPRGEGSRLRGEILDAARELLQEGSGAVTLRAVARAAGISAPSIYRHFEDVDAVLRAVVDEAFADLARRLREAAAGASTPVGRLVAVCEGYLDFAREQPQRYRLMFGGVWDASAGADEAQRAERAGMGMDAFAVLVERLAECVEAGASTSADVPADAVALWVGLHGLADLRTTTPLFPWPEGLADSLVRSLSRLDEGPLREA